MCCGRVTVIVILWQELTLICKSLSASGIICETKCVRRFCCWQGRKNDRTSVRGSTEWHFKVKSQYGLEILVGKSVQYVVNCDEKMLHIVDPDNVVVLGRSHAAAQMIALGDVGCTEVETEAGYIDILLSKKFPSGDAVKGWRNTHRSSPGMDRSHGNVASESDRDLLDLIPENGKSYLQQHTTTRALTS